MKYELDQNESHLDDCIHLDHMINRNVKRIIGLEDRLTQMQKKLLMAKANNRLKPFENYQIETLKVFYKRYGVDGDTPTNVKELADFSESLRALSNC